MATYNTLPTVSEDALINEPKAPQNRRAVAIVAAVCFASASIGALVQPHAARGITSNGVSPRAPPTSVVLNIRPHLQASIVATAHRGY